MADTIVEANCGAGKGTLTLKLFEESSDVLANDPADTANEEANRDGLYLWTVTESLNGRYHAHIYSGDLLVRSGYVGMADDTNVHHFEDSYAAMISRREWGSDAYPPGDTGDLGINYTTLSVAIADYLGWGRNTEGGGSDWTTEQIARLDAIIKSGLHQVYYPSIEHANGIVYQWSWMRPVGTLTTNAPYTTGTITVVDGVVTLAGGTWPSWATQGELVISGGAYTVSSRDGDTQITLDDTTLDVDAGTSYSLARYLYDLPAGFGGFTGDMTYRAEQSELYPPIRLVSDLMIRRRRQEETDRDRPYLAAVRPKTFDPEVGQRHQLIFEPTPDAAYDIEYPYKVEPSMLDASNPIPLGGPGIHELILESCLAVAEQRYRDETSIHTDLFVQKLRAAIADDAESFSPDSLGYNADYSERRDRGMHDGVAVHSYDGTYYYDRNP